MSNVAQLADHQWKQKRLEVTSEMLTQIKSMADADLAAEDIVVFEATAINTRPLNKPGSIFDKGRVTRGTLTEMADRLNNGVESIPLHTMHMQGDEIPVGKVFSGSVHDGVDGEAELRVQFYMPKSEASLIEKIDLGILDETSIGLKSKHLLCSECGFDYFAEDSSVLSLWDRTCENDHTIGENGVHGILSGVDTWMELSLVSRGAAHKAKIHGRAKQVMSQEQQDRIAASGFSPDAVTLFASPQPQPKKENEMAVKPEVPATPAAPAEFDAKAAHDELIEKFDALLTLMTPAEEAAAEEEEDSELDALKAQVGELKEEIAKLGKPKVEDLAPDLTAGGVALDTITDAEKAQRANLVAFKTRK